MVEECAVLRDLWGAGDEEQEDVRSAARRMREERPFRASRAGNVVCENVSRLGEPKNKSEAVAAMGAEQVSSVEAPKMPPILQC